MTGKIIQKWLDSRTDLTDFQMKTSDPNIVIEFEFYEVDERGNYLEPKDRTFDRVDICLPQTGAIYQVCQRDGESMDSFLTRVAKRYNKIKKEMLND